MTQVAATGLSLSPKAVELVEGQSFTIKPTITPSNTGQTALTWGSDANVTHTGNGTYKAKEIGSYYTTSVNSTISVAVTANPSISAKFSYKIHNIRLYNNSDKRMASTTDVVELGATAHYYFRKGPDDSGEYLTEDLLPTSGYTVTSDYPSVATVGKTNSNTCVGFYVKPVSSGSTNIRISVNGEQVEILPINVTAVRAKSVSVSPSFVELMEGQKVTLKATLTPSNTTDTKLIWRTGGSFFESLGDGVYEATKTEVSTSGNCKVFLEDDPNVNDTFQWVSYTMAFCNFDTKKEYESDVLSVGTIAGYFFKKGNSDIVTEPLLDKAGFVVSSSDTQVATVTQGHRLYGSKVCWGFVVTPVKAGTTTVSVRIRNVTRTLAITVK